MSQKVYEINNLQWESKRFLKVVFTQKEQINRGLRLNVGAYSVCIVSSSHFKVVDTLCCFK